MLDQKIYLDYAASTPVDPEVFEAMRPYFSERFGNPGSLHSFGQEAIAAVDKAREAIAGALGVEFRQILFTASATEANNLALRGVSYVAKRSSLKNPKIIVSAIEHESILETVHDLEHEGIEVASLAVDRRGIVDVKQLQSLLDERTALVSIMFASNEIGTVQPIAAVAEALKAYRTSHVYPLLHTDAAQGFQFLDCNVKTLGVDLMTISSHKIYGPKGAGALYARDAKLLTPIVTGGGQEFGVRSGTENVPAIVGFAKACELIAQSREEGGKKIGVLRERLWQGIKKIIPSAEMNGEGSLPSILNVYFPGHETQDLLTKFDLAGLAASAGSACHARALTPSYVIEALGYPKERIISSVRFSLGRPTTEEEIDRALAVMRTIVKVG